MRFKLFAVQQHALPKAIAIGVGAVQLAFWLLPLTNPEDFTTTQQLIMLPLAIAAAVGLLLCWVNLRLSGRSALLSASALLLTSAYYNPPAAVLASVFILFLPIALPAVWLL